MRARLAVQVAGVQVEIREILLKDKPQAMLDISPKGTVPVLQLPNQVLDESRDIMSWAFSQNCATDGAWDASQTWLDENDQVFKYWLDRYKYADRYPEHPASFYRSQGEIFLHKLELLLAEQTKRGKPHFLLGDSATVADYGIFPFVRQFSMVDQNAFAQIALPLLKVWLSYWLDSVLFQKVMQRLPVWSPEQEPRYFGRE